MTNVAHRSGMTRRDLAWRAAGGGLLAASCVAAQLGVGGEFAGIGYFLAAIAGIVLIVNGHRVATIVRAERHGHALTAAAVHAGRIRRRVPRDGQSGR